MTTILVVDDDPHIRKLVRVLLQNEGLAVLEAEDGRDALRTLAAAPVELVVLDIMMPHMDGWELCRELREQYDHLPLLMLTAKGETAQKVKGFELGTDDYLVKPFDPAELAVRVKALLKRYRIAAAQEVTAGKVTMNRKTFEVRADGQSLTMPLKEFELLYKLASYPGKTFSRDQLIEQIWGYDYEGNERTVDVHVNRLRERFSEEESGFRISTIRGLGYRLEVLG
ncbi:response regulator transcription factor [Paenibacillus athensensis]|uniref:Heme response regulator HssR n=1 Tax=Paenibacillus athensensis TaxID=1967502 RepID=A0A4Y8Q8T8_9BACL|nr:response regulator transcription factor [Paenibacillus athensensis]MCD1260102.1 response regulator transcription factor [Paenibacillus athensensis]